MANLWYVMGKSAAGKDHVYQELQKRIPSLKPLITYTTRPLRLGEQQGREYHFTDEAQISAFEKEGKLIEKRVYQTLHGPWTYATVDDGSFSPEGEVSAVAIGTLESFEKLKNYYGADHVIPIYLEATDRERLRRAIHREDDQEKPNMSEVCRRYLADEQDFSEEKLKAAGITKRYWNMDLERCLEEIAADVVNYA